MTFRLSPSYGLTTGHEANEWFIDMLRDHEEFEVETDRAGEAPMPFWSETVRQVVAGLSYNYCTQTAYSYSIMGSGSQNSILLFTTTVLAPGESNVTSVTCS